MALKPPTPELIRAQQKAMAEADTAAKAKTNVPMPAVTNGSTALAVPDNRTAVQQYIDDIAPASIVGRMITVNMSPPMTTQSLAMMSTSPHWLIRL